MVFFPSSENMRTLVEFVKGIPELAWHLYKGFVRVTENSHPELSKALEDFAISVEKDQSQSKIFEGEAPLRPAEAREAKNAPPPPLPSIPGANKIQLEITVHPNSGMDRAYKIGDRLVDGTTSEFLDGVLKQWFAANNISRRQGIMYQTDAAGNTKPIAPEALSTLFQNSQDQISRMVQDASKKKGATYNIEHISVNGVVAQPQQEPSSSSMGTGGR